MWGAFGSSRAGVASAMAATAVAVAWRAARRAVPRPWSAKRASPSRPGPPGRPARRASWQAACRGSRAPVEPRHAGFRLELPGRVADGALRDEHCLGGQAEAQPPCGGFERAVTAGAARGGKGRGMRASRGERKVSTIARFRLAGNRVCRACRAAVAAAGPVPARSAAVVRGGCARCACVAACVCRRASCVVRGERGARAGDGTQGEVGIASFLVATRMVARRRYSGHNLAPLRFRPRRSTCSADQGAVVQSVRIPACHAGGRGFESRPLRQILKKYPRQAGIFLFPGGAEEAACAASGGNRRVAHACATAAGGTWASPVRSARF